MKDKTRVAIVMLGVAVILSFGGFGKYAGAGLIGAGLWEVLLTFEKLNKKEKKK